MTRLLLIAFLLACIRPASRLSEGFDSREATIDSVHRDLFNGVTTCRVVVSSFLSRIEALNGQINAILSLNPKALSVADELDLMLASGNATQPLFCIPIVLKDNWDTVDMPTTGGCLALAESQPTRDSPSVIALKSAGAIILGKANLHELALEGLSVSSLGGQTINPYDQTRTPGGSSGGSGAAVAASFAVLATGTDTVNSLRNPASANSLFSIRPTRGLITRSGTIPVSYTQDAIGPIARTVKDVAIILTVLARIGYDSQDNATALRPATHHKDYSAALTTGSLQGLRLGILGGFFNYTASDETTPVNQAMANILDRLSEAGSTLVHINDIAYNTTSLGALDVQRYEFREAMDSYLSSSALGGFHPSSLRQLYSNSSHLVIPAQYEQVKTALSSSTCNDTYAAVQSSISELTFALEAAFASHKVSFIVYPEQKNLVVKLASPSQSGRNGILAALTGSPVVTIPAGLSDRSIDAPRGVPVGMEAMGRPWAEEDLLRFAYQVERLTKVRRAPAMAEPAVALKTYRNVPRIRPNKGNIVSAYPIGKL